MSPSPDWQPTESRPAGPEVRLAVVGLGPMARQHLQVLRALPGVSVVGLCSRSEEKRAAFEAEYGVPARWADTDRMLDELAPDGVVIAVSVAQVAAVAARVLERGVAALIEKPAGLSAGETDQLDAIARASGAKAMVGFNRRFYAHILRSAELVRDAGGLTGIVVEAPERPVDFQRPHLTDEVRDRYLVANAHTLDLLTFFAGDVAEVHAAANAWAWPFGDAFNALVRFRSGVAGHYVSYWTSPGRWSVRLYAPELRITIEPLEEAVAWYRGRDPEPIATAEIDRRFKAGLWAQASHFVDVVQGRADVAWPACSLADAAATTRLADAMLDARPAPVR
jgi:predicted dehydrogenase